MQWVATGYSAAAAALEWAQVGPQDLFVELGCGDGRVALEAAKRGARAVCVERDPEMAAEARGRMDADAAGTLVEVLTLDLFEVNLTHATVVFLFLLPEINAKLQPVLSRAPALRLVLSHKFEIYGWPCGQRLRVHDDLFLRWDMPNAVHGDNTAQPSQVGNAWHDDRQTGLGAADMPSIIDHGLECAVEEDAVRNGWAPR